MRKAIILIGPRASGKTTIGKMLAADLALTFVDTDEALQQRTGKTIAQIVDEEGWPAFREIESQILQDFTSPEHVIATGGGMVLSEQNRNHMKNNGMVFYLNASIHALVERLSANPAISQRPSLTGLNIIDELSSVLQEREKLYRSATHFVIDADRNKALVMQDIFNLYLSNVSHHPANQL